MKTCIGCKYAKWKLTSNGRMHPSGEGRCQFEWKPPVLPAAFYFYSGEPKPSGGFIERKRVLPDHCAYYQREIK